MTDKFVRLSVVRSCGHREEFTENADYFNGHTAGDRMAYKKRQQGKLCVTCEKKRVLIARLNGIAIDELGGGAK